MGDGRRFLAVDGLISAFDVATNIHSGSIYQQKNIEQSRLGSSHFRSVERHERVETGWTCIKMRTDPPEAERFQESMICEGKQIQRQGFVFTSWV